MNFLNDDKDMLEQHLIFFSEAKSQIYLLQRLTRFENIKRALKALKNEGSFNFKEWLRTVQTTLRKFVEPCSASEMLFSDERVEADTPFMNNMKSLLLESGDKNKVKAYLIQLLEFVFRHLQVFHNQ